MRQRIDINVVNAHDLTKACRSVEDQLRVVLLFNDKKYSISSIYENTETDELQILLSEIVNNGVNNNGF